MVPIDEIANLNNQMIDDNTYGYLIEKDKYIVDIDDEKDYLYARSLFENNFYKIGT